MNPPPNSMPKAHPRWRGEHLMVHFRAIFNYGSSPLARGALIVLILGTFLLRLIPAGAGSTNWGDCSGTTSAAHPRWRGEHSPMQYTLEVIDGSSPLARGAPTMSVSVGIGRRLIPAGAGSTGNVSRRLGDLAAHPRWRGEHIARCDRVASRIGSSPLARGALKNTSSQVTDRRLIPAGAGSTVAVSLRVPLLPAHPRWRGEHIGRLCLVVIAYGSSPLARGARSQASYRRERSGLIPAGAGSTLACWQMC